MSDEDLILSASGVEVGNTTTIATKSVDDDAKTSTCMITISDDTTIRLNLKDIDTLSKLTATNEKLPSVLDFFQKYETLLVEKIDNYKSQKTELDEMKEKIQKLEQRNVELEKILSGGGGGKQVDSQTGSLNNSTSGGDCLQNMSFSQQQSQDTSANKSNNDGTNNNTNNNNNVTISNFMNNQIVMPSSTNTLSQAASNNTNLAFQSNTASNLIIQNNSTNNLVVHNKVNFMHAPSNSSNTSQTLSMPTNNQSIPNINQGGLIITSTGLVYLPPMANPNNNNNNNDQQTNSLVQPGLVTSTPSKVDMLNIGNQRNHMISPGSITQLFNDSLKAATGTTTLHDELNGFQLAQQQQQQQQCNMQPAYILSNGQLVPVQVAAQQMHQQQQQQPNQPLQIIQQAVQQHQTPIIIPPTPPPPPPTTTSARKQPTLKAKAVALTPSMTSVIGERGALVDTLTTSTPIIADLAAKKHRAIRPKPSTSNNGPTLITNHQQTTIHAQSTTTDDILAKAASMIFSPNELNMQLTNTTTSTTTSPVRTFVDPSTLITYQIQLQQQQQQATHATLDGTLKQPSMTATKTKKPKQSQKKKSENPKNPTVAALTSSAQQVERKPTGNKIQIDLLNDSVGGAGGMVVDDAATNALIEAQKLLESLTNVAQPAIPIKTEHNQIDQKVKVECNADTWHKASKQANNNKNTKKKRSKSPETISMPLLDEFFSIGGGSESVCETTQTTTSATTTSHVSAKIDLNMNKKDLKDLYDAITSPTVKQKANNKAKAKADRKNIVNVSLTPSTSPSSSSMNTSAVGTDRMIPEHIEFELSEIDKMIDQVESIHDKQCHGVNDKTSAISSAYAITLGDLDDDEDDEDDENNNTNGNNPLDLAKLAKLKEPKAKAKSKEFLSSTSSDSDTDNEQGKRVVQGHMPPQQQQQQRVPLKPENSQHQRKRGRPPKTAASLKPPNDKQQQLCNNKKLAFKEIDFFSDDYDDLAAMGSKLNILPDNKPQHQQSTLSNGNKKSRGRPKKHDVQVNVAIQQQQHHNDQLQNVTKSLLDELNDLQPVTSKVTVTGINSPIGQTSILANGSSMSYAEAKTDVANHDTDITLASLASPKRKRGRPAKLQPYTSPVKAEMFVNTEPCRTDQSSTLDSDPCKTTSNLADNKENTKTDLLPSVSFNESQVGGHLGGDSTTTDVDDTDDDDQQSTTTTTTTTKRKHYGSTSDLSDSCVTTIAALTADAKPKDKRRNKRRAKATKATKKATKDAVKTIRDNEYAGLTRFETNFTRMLCGAHSNNVNALTNEQQKTSVDELQTVVDSLKDKEASQHADTMFDNNDKHVKCADQIGHEQASDENEKCNENDFGQNLKDINANETTCQEQDNCRKNDTQHTLPVDGKSPSKTVAPYGADDDFDESLKQTVANETVTNGTKNFTEIFSGPTRPVEEHPYDSTTQYWQTSNVDETFVPSSVTISQHHHHQQQQQQHEPQQRQHVQASNPMPAYESPPSSTSSKVSTATVAGPASTPKPTYTPTQAPAAIPYSYEHEQKRASDFMGSIYNQTFAQNSYYTSNSNSFYPAATTTATTGFHQKQEQHQQQQQQSTDYYVSPHQHTSPTIVTHASRPTKAYQSTRTATTTTATAPVAPSATKEPMERYAPQNTIQLNSLFDTVMHQSSQMLTTSMPHAFAGNFVSDLYSTTTSQLQQQQQQQQQQTKSSSKHSKTQSTSKSKKTQQQQQQQQRMQLQPPPALPSYQTPWYGQNNILQQPYGNEVDANRAALHTANTANAAYLTSAWNGKAYGGNTWNGLNTTSTAAAAAAAAANVRSHAASMLNSGFPFLNMDPSTHNAAHFANQPYNYSYTNNHLNGHQSYTQDFLKGSFHNQQHQESTPLQNQVQQQHTVASNEQAAAFRHHFPQYAPINLLAQNQSAFTPGNWTN